MTLLFKEDIRYPDKRDKFFIEDGNNSELSQLHKTFQDLGSYADNYQSGALCLIDRSLKDESVKDYNIYPIIFLIRHYLELRLKELILGLSYCKDQTRNFPKHHNIEKLWSKFKQDYSSIGEDTKDNRFKVIDKLIKEMAAVDPASMAFRYPEDKDGVKTQKLEFVNLNNLKETFIRVCFVFDGVAMQIAHYKEITEDMMRDAYENYQ